MEVKFSRYDTADYLRTEDDITAYLDAVMEDGDPSLIAAALGDLACTRNLSQLARCGNEPPMTGQGPFRRWRPELRNRGESHLGAWSTAHVQADSRRARNGRALIACGLRFGLCNPKRGAEIVLDYRMFYYDRGKENGTK